MRTRHGHYVGGRASPTYQSWRQMRSRCFNARHHAYADYGGRGVTLCDRWRDSFGSFLADMGVRPAGTSIDRFPDRDGNYEPGNCRWATHTMQMRNRRGGLDDVSVAMIRHMNRRGARQRDLAWAFGVAQSNISRAISGEAWSDI